MISVKKLSLYVIRLTFIWSLRIPFEASTHFTEFLLQALLQKCFRSSFGCNRTLLDEKNALWIWCHFFGPFIRSHKNFLE